MLMHTCGAYNGLESLKKDKKKFRELLNFKVANNIRFDDQKDLPGNNQLNQKTSNIFKNRIKIPQKVGIRSISPLLDIYLKDTSSYYKEMYSTMILTVLLIHNSQNLERTKKSQQKKG